MIRKSFYPNKKYSDTLAQLQLDSYEKVMAFSGDDYAAQSRTTSTVRVKLEQDGVMQTLFLKRYWYDKPVWKYSVRQSRAYIEQRNLQWMRKHKFPAPDVVLWGEYRTLLSLKSCFIITAAVEDSQNLDEFLPEFSQRQLAKDELYAKRQAIARLASLLRQKHELGYVDYDFHFRNVLIVPADGEYEFSFIDSPKGAVRTGSTLAKGKRYDLACLNKHALKYLSRTDCLRFMQAYLDKENLTKQDFVYMQTIEELSEKMRRKSARKRAKEALR